MSGGTDGTEVLMIQCKKGRSRGWKDEPNRAPTMVLTKVDRCKGRKMQ